MKDYCSAALRNTGNVYRRGARQRADRKSVPDDPAKLPDGAVAEAPMAVEIAPVAPQKPVTDHPRFCSSGAPAPSPEGMG